MRVAIYTETFLPKIDGIVKVLCLTLEHLNRRGVEAVVVAPDHGGNIREYAGAQVIGVPAIKNPVYPEGRISLMTPSAYQRIRAFNPHLMHSFHPIWTGLAGLLFAKMMHVPALSSFHLDIERVARFYRLNVMSGISRHVTTWAFNRSDYALAPSKLVQSQMRANGVHKVGLWRRGVDAEQFHPRNRSTDMRALLSDGHTEDRLLLYVGRLAPEKQIHQMRAVLERVPGTRLALVGGGPAEPSLRKHFEGLPVTFAGYLTGQKLAQAYASADVFMFASAFESFGLVLLEAMASGVPVVSSRVGGAQDMITDGESGYTFDVNDIDGMVNGVQQTLADPARLTEMGLVARRHAERQAWPAMMDELIACYDALLSGKPSPI
ncbi:MAG: glycosyltransferase family 1 protein [Anaerolineae bacterium]|nr:glycosyltransferase family 1 protein [Anaerolineae bacterium]